MITTGRVSIGKWIICIAWMLFCVLAFSDAGQNVMSVIAALVFASVWMFAWLIRLIKSFRCRRQTGDDVGTQRNISAAWAVEPAVLILGGSLAVSGILGEARFALSLSALNSYAEEVRRGEVNLKYEWSHPVRIVGLYAITQTELLADGTVRVITSSDRLMDKAGFANAPHGMPMRRGEDSYKRISGAWWVWHESW